MPVEKRLYRCRGGNHTISLYSDRLVIGDASLADPKSHELPIKRIRAVIVERKSIIPFATLAVLAAIAALLIKYNGLWFLFNLRVEDIGWMSMAACAVSIVSAIPTLSRAMFVNVTVSWNGHPSSFRARFVLAHRGRRLATLFREASAGS